MRRFHGPAVLIGVCCLMLAAYVEIVAAQSSSTGHVVVVGQAVDGAYLNLTVTTYSRSGVIRNAGLFLNDSLISNEVGGVWLSYDSKQVLPFQLRALTTRAELRIVYDTSQGDNSTTVTQSTQLTFADAANVRPVAVEMHANGNASLLLQNLGKGTAPELLASLESTTGAIIGHPYYQRMASLRASQTSRLTFGLHESPDKAHLVLEAGGHRALFVVYLRGGTAGTGSIRLTTDYPSLEAAPSGTVQFNVRLTNSGGERLVRLATEGLPDSFTPSMSVQGRSVQTLLVPAAATRDILLNLQVPSGTTEPTTSFELVVRDADDGAARIASIGLSLTVSAAARLDLVGRNWNAFLRDGRAEAVIGIRNSGTGPAHQVTLQATPPPGWTVRTEPSTIERLDAAQTVEVHVVVTAPKGTADGRYVVDVVAQAQSIAPSRERSLSVDVDQPAPSRLPWLLAVVVVGGAATILIIRVRRR